MEIWDEHQWEEYLRESDRLSEVFQQFVDTFVRENPPPPDDAPDAEREAWDAAFQVHLAEKMGWRQWPGDEIPDWMDESFDSADEALEGDGWKADLEDLIDDDDERSLPVWRAADAFRKAVMAWVASIPEESRGSATVELCSGAIQIVARLGAAHAMGYQIEMLGGNIAWSKRALQAANRALAALQHFRDAPFMHPADYRRLYEQGYEVRNALGLHVQQLRERFEQGGG